MSDDDLAPRVGSIEKTVSELKTDVAVIGVTVVSIKDGVDKEAKAREKAEMRRKNNVEWAVRAAFVPLIVAAVTFVMNGGLGK